MEMVNAFLVRFMAALVGNIFVRLLLIVVCADMVFGSLRAAKYRCWNSAVGIDGAIRKAGMLACVFLFTAMDMILRVNLLNWLPVNAQNSLDAMGIVKVGATELFALLFILYEATSVLKNMLLCGLPVPAGIREKLAAWLDSMTDETPIDMEYETGGDHAEIDMTLDPAQLGGLTLQQLHVLAKEMGVPYDENATVEDLAHLLADEHVTAVI